MSSNQSPSPKRGLQEGPRWPNGSDKLCTSTITLKLFSGRLESGSVTPIQNKRGQRSSSQEPVRRPTAWLSLYALPPSASRKSGRGWTDGPGLLLQALRQGVSVISGGSGTLASGSGHPPTAVVCLLSGGEHPQRSRGTLLALWGQASVATFVRTIVATSVRTVFQTEPRRWPLFPPAGAGAGAQSASEGFSRKRRQGKRGGSAEGSEIVNDRCNVRSNSHSHSHRSTSPIASETSFPSQETKSRLEPVPPGRLPRTPRPPKNAPRTFKGYRRTPQTPFKAPGLTQPQGGGF